MWPEPPGKKRRISAGSSALSKISSQRAVGTPRRSASRAASAASVTESPTRRPSRRASSASAGATSSVCSASIHQTRS